MLFSFCTLYIYQSKQNIKTCLWPPYKTVRKVAESQTGLSARHFHFLCTLQKRRHSPLIWRLCWFFSLAQGNAVGHMSEAFSALVTWPPGPETRDALCCVRTSWFFGCVSKLRMTFIWISFLETQSHGKMESTWATQLLHGFMSSRFVL